MAATRREPPKLRALTAAALALPGLARAAEGDSFGFQVGRYREGERSLYGVNTSFDPIEVESLHARVQTTLFDRYRLAFDYVEDTWSGATPVTTAPVLLRGNRPSAPDGVSGATPYVRGDLFFDSRLRPVRLDPLGQVVATDTRLVHTLSSASPESRRQGSLELGHDWDEFGVDVGGGLSLEDDYESRFASISAHRDLNQKRTRIDAGLSYTWSDTEALLDQDSVPYVDTSGYLGEIRAYPATGDRELRDDRGDFGVELGLSQVLDRNSVLETRVSYVRSSGYLANPYKVMEVAFLDPAQQFLAPPGGYYGQVFALLEQRPDEREQWIWETRLARYLPPLDAALHLEYRLFSDDWGIDAHTVEASLDQPLGRGFTLTPRIRYYSQGEADFYETLLVTPQAYRTVVSDPDTGEIVSITPFDPALLPRDFSSDHRLSAYGTLGAGLGLAKEFARGVRVAADVEYYTHRGDLRLGGRGEGSYADFDAWQVSLALELDASALHAFGYRRRDVGHARHGGSPAPAGVALAHMLDAGEILVGYRSLWSRQDGALLRGSHSAPDAEILAAACEGSPCRTVPDQMDVHMHMLELGYAPTRSLTFMLMPQFASMTMERRPLAGAAPDNHGQHDHESGGIGDLPVVALIRLLDYEEHHLHGGLGVSVPLGDVDQDFRRSHQESRGRVDYGMQTGSGTWDLLPTLTYTGGLAGFSWGAQVGGVHRLESENDSGYALGDVIQATVWGGRRVTDWLSLSLRGLYTHQGQLEGEYDTAHDTSGPMDFPENHGGEYFDLGLGASVALTSGYLAGNEFALEWLEPLHDDVDGYQLERRGALSLAWSVRF